MLRKVGFLLTVLISATACYKESGSQEIYNQIVTGAVHNKRARIFAIDTLSSELIWRYTGPNGEMAEGTLKPDLGSVVMENSMIVAGFFEADVWKATLKISDSGLIGKQLKMALQDSVPILARSGRKIRMDLSQAGRNIRKSDFNTYSPPVADSLHAYVLGANLEVADSTRFVSLPATIYSNQDSTRITGEYTLIPQEYGIKPLSTVKKGFPDNSRILISYRLIFRPLRSDRKLADQK